MASADQDTLLVTSLHLFDIVLKVFPGMGGMAVRAHREAVFIRTKPLCCVEIKLRTGCIDQIIIVNVLPLAIALRVGVLNGNIPFLAFRITFGMDFNRFGLFKHNAPSVIDFFQFKADIINSHLADTDPDV